MYKIAEDPELKEITVFSSSIPYLLYSSAMDHINAINYSHELRVMIVHPERGPIYLSSGAMAVFKILSLTALLVAPAFSALSFGARPEGRPLAWNTDNIQNLEDLLTLGKGQVASKAEVVSPKEPKAKDQQMLRCGTVLDAETTIGCLMIADQVYRVLKHDPMSAGESELFEVQNLNGEPVSRAETVKVMNYVFKMMEALKERERKMIDANPFGF
uniref:Protein-tyrosine-phosphatase n=1 Tax=Steinernema glaseri TaxID=37863 RepID=A0A1I7YHW2_9BILA